MSKSYKNVRPKKHFVYSVEGLMKLYSVCRNTISNWIAEGLQPSEEAIPYVFNGSEVRRFHESKRLENKRKLRKGEFKCFKCKNRVFPDPGSLERIPSKNGFSSLWAECPICTGVIIKQVNEIDCDKILTCVDTNTSLASLDEGWDQFPVGTVKDGLSEGEVCYVVNDRILHNWLQFAGCWAEKTITAKLAAIRRFERFCEGKEFSKVNKNDAARFREHLKSNVESFESEQLSISTVRHEASHVKTFFAWLIEQKGYRSLDKSLPRYFELPRKFEATVLVSNDRPTPTLAEASQMIANMRSETIKQRRDRAMVSIAFLAALRADTITSLQIGHLELGNRLVVQDGRRSRTKNGKSLRIKFFPMPQIFTEIVRDWQVELLKLGFQETDALFPDEKFLLQNVGASCSDRILAMSSTHAVATAFKTASGSVGKSFSPHSAKHLIGQLSLKICKSPEELKVWSINMGHENEEVTLRYYKQIPEERVFEVFEQFDEETEDAADDKDLMLLYHEHKLDRGTPEFERATRLVLERQARGEKSTT